MSINIGLSDKERKDIADGLSALLADSYILYLKTQNYHWNVTGPMFSSLHALFEAEYTDLAAATDTLAERIRALDFKSPGSFEIFKAIATIKEETGSPSAVEMIKNLLSDQETIVSTARKALKLAEAADDQPTVDILTDRLEIHEKNAWMLRASL